MRMSSGQLSSSLPPPPTSRYASAWSNALKARLPVQLGGWSGVEATERLTQASKDKASLGRPQFQLLHHLHLAAITLFRKDKRKFLLKKAYNSATSKLIFSTCKYFCTYIHTWTHTDIQNPFFSWQKALSEARVGPCKTVIQQSVTHYLLTSLNATFLLPVSSRRVPLSHSYSLTGLNSFLLTCLLPAVSKVLPCLKPFYCWWTGL